MGLLGDLFRKKKALPPADMGLVRADMHSHLIPGIDDGAATVEESVALILELQGLGYSKLITTPHITSDHYKNTPEIIRAGLEGMRTELRNRGIQIELEAAAEYYTDYDFEAKIDGKELLTFGDNYVLFELSFVNAPEQLDQVVFKMRTSGYRPVLAHVERYPYWYDKPEMYERLAGMGVSLQLNINSLSGQYGPGALKTGRRLIDKNMIDLIGTDCHNMNYINTLKATLTDPHVHRVINSGRLLNASL